MKSIKLIIAGSRTIPEINSSLAKKISNLLSNVNYDSIEIISGTARGGDKFGENYANNYNIPIKQFPANWDKYGKSAGYIRNVEMADYATHLIAILDMTVPSKGTRHMINTAREKGLLVKVIEYYGK